MNQSLWVSWTYDPLNQLLSIIWSTMHLIDQLLLSLYPWNYYNSVYFVHLMNSNLLFVWIACSHNELKLIVLLASKTWFPVTSQSLLVNSLVLLSLRFRLNYFVNSLILFLIKTSFELFRLRDNESLILLPLRLHLNYFVTVSPH